MRVHDLGRLSGPVLLFGGPYSNLSATRALLEVARVCAIAPSSMICTGDVVAYCARASETADLVRAAGCHVIAGNCERQLAAGAGDCGCGFAPGSACDLLSGAWYAHARAQLSDDARAWMGGLPDMAVFVHEGARWGVLHGGATDVSRFFWPVSDAGDFEAEWDAAEATTGPLDGIVAGHCGLAFQRDLRRGPWVNAGAIGLPPNDGTARTRFGILEGGKVEIHSLAYDAAPEARAMRAAGLTQGYDRALETGYWPSEDVLPPELRRGPAVTGCSASG